MSRVRPFQNLVSHPHFLAPTVGVNSDVRYWGVIKLLIVSMLERDLGWRIFSLSLVSQTTHQALARDTVLLTVRINCDLVTTTDSKSAILLRNSYNWNCPITNAYRLKDTLMLKPVQFFPYCISNSKGCWSGFEKSRFGSRLNLQWYFIRLYSA